MILHVKCVVFTCHVLYFTCEICNIFENHVYVVNLSHAKCPNTKWQFENGVCGLCFTCDEFTFAL